MLTLLIILGHHAWGTTYRLTKVTSVSAGNKYVFERNSRVFSKTVSSKSLQTTGTYSTFGLAGTEAYVWTLETAKGGFYLKNVSLASSQYLNNTSGTDMSFGSNSSIWSFSFTDGVALISNTSNSNRFIGETSSGSKVYKAYATGNLATYGHDITVYVLEEEPPANISMTTTDVNLNRGETNTRTATSSTSGASISYSSNVTDVATVNSSTGEVTAVSAGSATITATVTAAGYSTATASYIVNVSDPRTPVNLSTFTATNTTLIIGGAPNTTTTSVTNDQGGWAAAYTYESSDEDVATVNSSGVVTAVAKGTATITCSLDMDPDDATYKAGSTTSKTIEITVNKPSHTASFSINGVIDPADDDTVEEDDDIPFPSAPASIGGKVFKGWTTGAIVGTQADAPAVLVTSATMSTADITYYAVYANEITGEGNVTLTIVPSTTNMPTSYGTANTFTQYTLEGKKFKLQQVYKNGEKLQWRAAGNENGTGTMYNTDALNKLQSIVITYDSSDANKNFTVKVGDAENPTSGTSITPTNVGSVYTYNCSSNNKNYFVLTNGSGAGYLTSIAITYKGSVTTYSDYCTSVTVPVTIGSAGYTTYVTPYNVSFPDGVTGYIATSTGASTVTLSEVTNVPADEPIVLKANAGNYMLPVITSATDDVSSNLLNASDGSIVGDGSTIFALGVGKTGTNKDKVGFYLVDNDVSIPEGKAYLTVPAAVKEFLAFSFDQATRVQELCPASSPSRTREEEIIFNLAGQRMSKMQRGVNIVNGKKVVVK